MSINKTFPQCEALEIVALLFPDRYHRPPSKNLIFLLIVKFEKKKKKVSGPSHEAAVGQHHLPLM